jgi:hypothetical protein
VLPTTSVAALLLLALVPGYAYLRLSEDARRPRDHSALDEFLEVLAVGLGTTGLASLVLVLCWPEEVAETLKKASLDSPDALRAVVVLGAVVAGLALGIACLGSWLTRLPGAGSYSANVWRATLGLRDESHLPWVVVELKGDDPRRLEGVLHAYTTLDGDHPRDLALLAPRISKDGTTWESGADFVIVSAEEIAAIWLRQQYDPGQVRGRRVRLRR